MKVVLLMGLDNRRSYANITNYTNWCVSFSQRTRQSVKQWIWTMEAKNTIPLNELRSVPEAPKLSVSPWLESDIEPDTNRKPLLMQDKIVGTGNILAPDIVIGDIPHPLEGIQTFAKSMYRWLQNNEASISLRN